MTKWHKTEDGSRTYLTKINRAKNISWSASQEDDRWKTKLTIADWITESVFTAELQGDYESEKDAQEACVRHIHRVIKRLRGLVDDDTRKRPTPKQIEVLGLIRDSIDKNGYAPTLDEMAQKLNRSKTTVHGLIDCLKQKGYIANDASKARSWVLL
mgnify:FL=1